MQTEGEMAIRRTGVQLHWEMLLGGLMEEDSKVTTKVGASLTWMVLSAKERVDHRMRIAHWQRSLNGRVTVLPEEFPCFILA
jgi:hypothetical protein